MSILVTCSLDVAVQAARDKKVCVISIFLNLPESLRVVQVVKLGEHRKVQAHLPGLGRFDFHKKLPHVSVKVRDGVRMTNPLRE